MYLQSHLEGKREKTEKKSFWIGKTAKQTYESWRIPKEEKLNSLSKNHYWVRYLYFNFCNDCCLHSFVALVFSPSQDQQKHLFSGRKKQKEKYLNIQNFLQRIWLQFHSRLHSTHFPLRRTIYKILILLSCQEMEKKNIKLNTLDVRDWEILASSQKCLYRYISQWIMDMHNIGWYFIRTVFTYPSNQLLHFLECRDAACSVQPTTGIFP